MLCEMAQNGTLAVVTESDRYAAEVMVYDASFSGDPFTWKLTSTDGTPIALSFATDNHRFAAATVAARDGQLRTTVRMMNTNSDTAVLCGGYRQRDPEAEMDQQQPRAGCF